MNKFLQNKDEVLRYLGYKNQVLDKVTIALIDELMDEMRSLIKARYIYKFFNIRKEKDKICIFNSNFSIAGGDIRKHLDKSEVCILMAATLGNSVDAKIRYYEKISMTKALILDACATTAIEELCDRICEELEEVVQNENNTLTSRYSPGYGDLPIDIQKKFLAMLSAEKSIGLTASSNSILIPRKSVTAIVGVVKRENNSIKKISCLQCNKYSNCMFRKGDDRCGN
ncbi:methionine synthase [Clostridium sp. UBA4395]|uniref:methionine synthase n=1 Tax=Clostridium sp. UBA4395 TaxID=1946360 RepID=UPI0032176C8A